MPDYVVIVGINYPAGEGERRAEPGDVVSDLSAEAAAALLEAGAIAPADTPATPAEE